MQIAIRHRLNLGLGAGIARSVQHLLLTPQSGPTQTVREWHIEMAGFEHAASFIDAFGNRAHLVSQVKPDPEIAISVSGLIDTIDRNGVIGRVQGDIPPGLYRRPTPATKAAGTITSKFRNAPKSGGDRIALLHNLMARVAEVLDGGGQSQSQDGQSQSQQLSPKPAASDYAHAFIGAARALDIPARYVTGYLYAGSDEPAGFHAWSEAWDDALGWIGFDAMLQLCPTDKHVRVAVGLDAVGTMPVRSIPVVGEPQVVAMSVEAAQ